MMAGDQSALLDAKQSMAGGQNNWLDEITDFTALANEYYEPSSAAGFSTYDKLLRTAKTQPAVERSAVKPWLEKQDAYTLHKPIRKRFPRNPYTVNNIMDLWEADLVDVQSLYKHND